VATKFVTVDPNICWSSVWNLLLVTLLAVTIAWWILAFWKHLLRPCVGHIEYNLVSFLSPMTVLYKKTENGICLACLFHFDFVLVTAGYNPLSDALFWLLQDITHCLMHYFGYCRI
jgi:hypothetical protein